MITLLFARHGQASFGQKNYDQLSDLGIKQAKMLGQHYANAQRKIDGIMTGAMVRQKDSATHFLQAYREIRGEAEVASLETNFNEQLIIEGLNEFDHKDVFIKSNPKFSTHEAILAEIAKAPMPKVRLSELFHDAFDRWHSGKFDNDYVESWSTFNKRVQGALDEVITIAQHKGQKEAKQKSGDSSARTFLIFTSGGVIAALVARLLDQGSLTAQTINKSLVNTGVTSITLKNDTLNLLSVNEHSHLYQAGESYLTWY